MSEKATMLRDADLAFGELRGAIDGLTDEDMRRVWLGTWGVREILIHISGWHDEMATALGRVGKGDAPYPKGTYDDFDAWNARFVDQKAGVKSADVVAELEASHRKLLAAAAGAAGGALRRGRRRAGPVRRGRRRALPRAHGADPSMATGLATGFALFDTAIGAVRDRVERARDRGRAASGRESARDAGPAAAAFPGGARGAAARAGAAGHRRRDRAAPG